MYLEIIPLKRVGDLEIGMGRHEIRVAMDEQPKTFYKTKRSKILTDGFRDFCVQVFYDDNDRAEYIELSRDPSIVAVLNGNRIFELPAVTAWPGS